jgi:D-alanine-D-alanine ligase
MNIIVLCGGLSAERDVSLSSGALITDALRRRGHNAVPVDLFFGYTKPYDAPSDIFADAQSGITGDISSDFPDLDALFASRAGKSRIGDNIVEICSAADIVFIALHGEDGEDGKIQALFDLTGIKYTGTGALGSAIAMNKDVAKQIFRQNGILTPDGIALHRGDEIKNVGFPCVVKPCSRGSSVGTSVVHGEADFGAAVELAFSFEDDIIVERYIAGRECDVGVLRGAALPAIEICPKSGFYDYKNKYQSGMTDEYCPADFPPDITQKLQSTAERVFEALKFQIYGRMDFIVTPTGEVYCLEGNTLPGMTPLSLLPQEARAVGIEYDELCEIIIRESLKKYGGAK